MSKFYINGEIVARQFEKGNQEDVCPQDFQSFIEGLNDGEDIELYFSSLGGDVFAGLQICSLLSEASKNGHRTIANVTSIAASIASVIACQCQELNIYDGAFLMCHLPWTCVQGNSKDLLKEIATLEQCKNSMMKVYRTKFNISDIELDKMLEAETWIDADNYKNYGLTCNIIDNGEPIKIAASIKNRFHNIPKRILNMNEEIKQEEIEETKVEEQVKPVEEKPIEEQPKVEEQPIEEPKVVDEEQTPEEMKKTIEELRARIAELEKELAEEEIEEEIKEERQEEVPPCDECKKCEELPQEEVKPETITKEEADKRVSGMQASMQKQINDFKAQIRVKDDELNSVKAELTSINQKLEKAQGELSEMASALEGKTKALELLNASVNAKAEELPTMQEGLAKCASAREKVEFLKSGKYLR